MIVWVCSIWRALRDVLGGIVMIVMIILVCRVGWFLRPCYRRDSYDSLGL
jgi:hypothetical protein